VSNKRMAMFFSPIHNSILCVHTFVKYKTSIVIETIPINLIKDPFSRIRSSQIDQGNCWQSNGTWAKAFDIIDFLWDKKSILAPCSLISSNELSQSSQRAFYHSTGTKSTPIHLSNLINCLPLWSKSENRRLLSANEQVSDASIWTKHREPLTTSNELKLQKTSMTFSRIQQWFDLRDAH